MSSSKSSEVRRIELKRKLSELQVFEDLARSRKAKAEVKADEAEMLAKLRLQAIRGRRKTYCLRLGAGFCCRLNHN